VSSAQPPAFLAPVASHGQNVHLGQVDFFLSSISYSSPVPQGTQNGPKFKILALYAFPNGSGTWGQLPQCALSLALCVPDQCLPGPCLPGPFAFPTNAFPSPCAPDPCVPGQCLPSPCVPGPLQAGPKFEIFLSMRPKCVFSPALCVPGPSGFPWTECPLGPS
jgi:hypothetical protein